MRSLVTEPKVPVRKRASAPASMAASTTSCSAASETNAVATQSSLHRRDSCRARDASGCSGKLRMARNFIRTSPVPYRFPVSQAKARGAANVDGDAPEVSHRGTDR